MADDSSSCTLARRAGISTAATPASSKRDGTRPIGGLTCVSGGTSPIVGGEVKSVDKIDGGGSG